MRTWLLAVALLSPAVGCLQFRGTGPIFGEGTGGPPPPVPTDALGAPIIPEAPPPPAPSNLISAGEIDATNHADAVKKLAEELEQDRQAAERFPNYSSVSRIERK